MEEITDTEAAAEKTGSSQLDLSYFSFLSLSFLPHSACYCFPGSSKSSSRHPALFGTAFSGQEDECAYATVPGAVTSPSVGF